MPKKKYIRKYKKSRRSSSKKDNFMLHEHSLSYGVTTDAFGTDGKTTPIYFTDFRNTADCAGMYRTFRILAYGMDFGACTLDPGTKTIRTINIALRGN